jgi:uncharacterized protein YpbB
LSIKGMNNMAMQIHEEVLEVDREFKKTSEEHVSDLIEAGEKKTAAAHEAFKAKAAKNGAKKLDTFEQTKALLLEGKTIEEIAKARELTRGTVIDHVEKIHAKEPQISLAHIRDAFPVGRYKKIYSAFQQLGTSEGGKRPLTPVMSLLGKGYEFDELRIVRLFL